MVVENRVADDTVVDDTVVLLHNKFLGNYDVYNKVVKVLELTLCTLLVVIATTPLRSDHNSSPDLEASPGKGSRTVFVK